MCPGGVWADLSMTPEQLAAVSKRGLRLMLATVLTEMALAIRNRSVIAKTLGEDSAFLRLCDDEVHSWEHAEDALEAELTRRKRLC